MNHRTHRGAAAALHAFGGLAGVALSTLSNVAFVLILAGAR